ncbi:MAG: YihY/virulence factor BrkB family protein [Gammaproteobacteria bacterium]|nr:YihY/virulence factor BrkB family protein [Gammaproteobacteria bacterium]MBU1601436.1 YihY/virulence factor BrkB family protein [Gammaproteobacteria bacterium]MBU2433631.1 YihY/virulence factor BrkB family protein [Gammaproteobacteria bacterium]MBU2449831.1 YihY/virulence factor BrkB family protein [Gammaproteobacteria bacterium]
MSLISKTDQQLIFHPLDFALTVLRNFRKNQGLLLAGAVAYYALLSLLPMIILLVLWLSHWVDQAELLATLQRYLEWLVPSQAAAVLADVSGFIDNGVSIGVVLLGTLVFFSSLTFSILQKAMAQIFAHRHATVKRHAVVAALLPYSLLLLAGIALFGITVLSVTIHSLTQESITLFGAEWSLRRLSGPAFYGIGLAGEILILTLFYSVLPVGRTRLRHALLGAAVITLIWEIVRHILVWYFATLSSASIVYGSLTTAVVVLFSIELAATLLLLGAQVISEYEQLESRLGDAG